MKILIVRPAATVVKRSAYNVQEEGIAKAYVEMGHECQLIFYTSDRECQIQQITFSTGKHYTIHWMPAIKLYDNAVFYGKHFKQLIAWAEVIVTEEYEQLQSCLLARMYPKKTVIYHGPYNCEYKKRYQKKSRIFDFVFQRSLQKRNIQFVAKSEKARETLLEKGFRHVRTIPVGIDMEKFSYADWQKALYVRKKEERLRLLYIGVLEDRRDIPFMIKLVKRVFEKGIPVSLDIIGTGEREYVEFCEKLTKETGVAEAIHFRGSMTQEALVDEYLTHDVFVLPTKYEIYGMVILEAMLFGRVVITTDNGGSSVLIKHERNGFILPSKIEDWVSLLEKLYLGQIDVNQISKCAQETVLRQEGWKQSAKQFIALFQKMVNE